jgi:hypothetical protein
MTDTLSLATAPARKDQASALLAHAAGYASHRTIAMGLRGGLLEELGRDPAGATADELAERLDLDPGYVAAWRRSALSAGVCERDGDRFRFALHMTTLLLDRGSAAYVGGSSTSSSSRRCSGFEASLASGGGCGGTAAAPTGSRAWPGPAPGFYTRLVPGGLGQVPGLADRLAGGGVLGDSACGAGAGAVRPPVPRHRRGPAQRPRADHGRHPVLEAQIDDQLLPAPTTTASSPATVSPIWVRPASRRCTP